MTTEHVSVTREFMGDLEKLVVRWTSKMFGRTTEWGDGNDCAREQCANELRRVISRATPSDVVPEHIGHPRSPGETRDEIEMFLRDAYAAGCNAALRNSLVVAMEYARREAPKLRAILKPSAPRVVTDEDVERACKARFPETWGMMAENLKVIYRATSRRMLESFATSLPAAIPPGYVVVPVEPTDRMIDAAERLWTSEEIYKAMLASAPQAGETK